MALDWSHAEVEATVADYLAMLALELRAESFNKSDHNRRLRRLLNHRSEGAVEFKHANISAVLIDLGYPYIDGYKPRSNYQAMLAEVVLEHIESDRVLAAATASAVDSPAAATPVIDDVSGIIVPAPMQERERSLTYERRVMPRLPGQSINYLEREARNASLGAAGEQFVVGVEHARLWQAGHKKLAERIEHVSRTQGDGFGYDIVSYEASGRERLIEVKTTRFGSMTPFFATRNEVNVSAAEEARYHLYRVFKFEESPKLFVLSGSLRQSCVLIPEVFRASLL